MKTKFFLFLAFFLIAPPPLVWAQQWQSVVTTSINEPYLDKLDQFANRDGIHLALREGQNGSIKYYRLNTSGSVVSSATISSSGNFPSITGSNDKVYIIYRDGGYIKGKYSTNAGSNWTNISEIDISTNTCNSLDAVYDNNSVHLVYSLQNNGYNYESYYYRLAPSNEWLDYKEVTDEYSVVGGYASVTVSQDRVHVSFNTGYNQNPGNQGTARVRDKYQSTWGNSQVVFGPSPASSLERIGVGNGNLFNFYYEFVGGMGLFYNNLNVKMRAVGSTTWSSAEQLFQATNVMAPVSFVTTSNGYSHILYVGNHLEFRTHNNISWSSVTEIEQGSSISISDMTSVSNDIYCVWKYGIDNYLKFKQNDAAPLAPQNLAQVNQTGHPRLEWSRNNEADINGYKVYRKYGTASWAYLATTTNLYYVDNTLNLRQAGDPAGTQIQYKLKAIDLNDNESEFSGTASCYVVGGELSKEFSGNEEMEELDYSVFANYPNPFNPTTKISFALESEQFVDLRIFDMNGSEVAILINQPLTKGMHTKVLDGQNLPSGMYVCRLITAKTVRSIKLALLK
ncbi:MAG: T9SS type A sorting domain-containing protein [Ignavibacteriales bacterium]|nr:MAG: T9SS type A sorting domain-containing protein [Ignavibacteriales bacterium]